MRISEDFYSLQCEGVTNGTPSYFIRLAGCNLRCGNPDMTKVKDTKSTSDFQQQLYRAKDPKATWLCDSMAVYLKGDEVSNEELENRFKKNNQLENILSGKTHLIWTGGEPTIQQYDIIDFIDYMNNKYHDANIFSEIETNGTIRTAYGFFGHYIQQVNCSPKLENSGNRKSSRYNPKVLQQINNFNNSWFKFVISTEHDVKSVYDEFIKPLNLDERKIILMPGLSKQEDYFERTKWVYEMGKKYNYKAISRGHIAAWDQTTGV